MPYVSFDKTKPAGASNGPTVMQHIRENLMAIRDGIVLGGLPGFNCAASGGSEDQPAQYLFTGTGVNSTERILAVVTWGTTGGALGNPETIVFTYSANSGTLYEAIGTLNVAYTANGYYASHTWSA